MELGLGRDVEEREEVRVQRELEHDEVRAGKDAGELAGDDGLVDLLIGTNDSSRLDRYF